MTDAYGIVYNSHLILEKRAGDVLCIFRSLPENTCRSMKRAEQRCTSISDKPSCDFFLHSYMSYALITGASRGIGKAIAYNLAARKKNLLLVARSEDLLNEISRNISNQYSVDAKFFCVDLTREDAAESIFEWVTKNNIQIDMLVNNAGYGLSGSFEKYTAAEHAQMMNVN